MARRRTRRRMLQGLAGVAALATAGRLGPGGTRAEAAGAPARPVVVRARRPGAIDPASGAVDAGKLADLLGAALTRAGGAKGPVEALRRLFRPADVVGIKVNTIAGRGLSPHPELVLRLAGWLQEAGVAARNVVIWDRTDRELSGAGFALNRDGPGVRCLGTNEDYDWTPLEWGAGGSCFARLLTSELTALINVAVLKDHDLAGISAGLKNWYGAIHNPNKHHGGGCNPYVAHLAAFPLIRDKLRLTLVDGLVGQCHGGPARSPRWAWPWSGVLCSTDPVAIDAVCWRAIEERRAEIGLPSLGAERREPKWIATAARLGLGEHDVARIEVVDV
ncbi:MAG: DUF362 domain-containing protein [Deltaproteobacteria bacterium]|nr:DUF362 domain-containing protein [Deltaproteobacteria bacterium]